MKTETRNEKMERVLKGITAYRAENDAPYFGAEVAYRIKMELNNGRPATGETPITFRETVCRKALQVAS